MPKYTENLNLFEYDVEKDGKNTYNISQCLNDNWDKIDSALGNVANLTTEQKANFVSAINEIVSNLDKKSSIDLNNLSALGQSILDRKVEVEALLQQNGYAKFSWKEDNKISSLIINWGRSTIPQGSAGVCNFATSFSNTMYSIVALAELDDGNMQDTIKGFLWAHKTTSSCLLRTTKTDAPTSYYIAIGT